MEAPIGTFMQYVYMMPEIAMITFKKWHEILMQPQLNDKYHYAALLQLFARGLAYANTHQILKAKTSLTSLESMLKEKDMYVILIPFNAPATGGTVAKYLLRGAIAENENNFTDAIINYKIAVFTQDSLIYNEPRDWLIPARHFLGNALLRVKKYKDAAIVFRENLKAEPGNYVGIKGLQNALTKRKKN
jgi:tetratricopeptide (TPR) repeat protein